MISDPLTIKFCKFTFDYTGRVQSVKLNSGRYKLEVWGSSGGENKQQINNGSYSGYAGKGGYSVGTLTLNKETTLYIYVGGSSTTKSGGWNGGGSSKTYGAGGGGSTDISLYGDDGSNEWNTSKHMNSRLIVAGGGGGSSHTTYPGWLGGSGGGDKGENGGCGQKGGTQTTGYKFGIGSNANNHSSGGGGGWYGGFAHNGLGWGPGGGGGSGFVYNSSTAENYPSGCILNSSFYLTNSKTMSGNTNIPSTTGIGTEQGHTGNGYAIITSQ